VLAERHTRSQAFFAGSAAQWDKLRAELFGERAELFALLGLLDPQATIGDLGCGAGHLSEAVAPFVGRVLAVDESPAMLKAARARLQQYENVELREGTIEKLPLADRSLDIAVLSLVLHYVADPALALAEARRVLAKGGRLLIVDMLEHDRAELVAEMGHIWPGFDAARVVSMLEEAGFTDIRLAPLPALPKAKGPTAFVAAARRS
jgi:ArsR family transcriptional regulator